MLQRLRATGNCESLQESFSLAFAKRIPTLSTPLLLRVPSATINFPISGNPSRSSSFCDHPSRRTASPSRLRRKLEHPQSANQDEIKGPGTEVPGLTTSTGKGLP